MPGPAVHLSILELQRMRCAANPALYKTVGSALASHKLESNLGSIGPDMIFWADWGRVTPVVNAVFDFYHTLDGVYEKLAAIWKPIGDAIDKVTSALSGGLSTAINDTVAYCSGILKTAMLDLITDKVNYFELFLHPDFQKATMPDVPFAEKGWNWLDFLHHRGTGVFNKALIRRARDSRDPAQQAYAYGWLSHVTADVVGHAYVNQAVGGPWRSHFQRHHIQENFMDVWTWGFYNTPGVTLAPPGGSYDFDSFTDLGSANLHNLIDMGDDLPESLQSLIADSLHDVYHAGAHPQLVSFPGKPEINRAYQMQKEAFEIMTGKDRRLVTPKVPQVFGDMEPPTFPGAGGSGGGSGGGGGGGGGGFNLLAALAAIAKFIADTLSYVADLALWLVSKITSPLTYPVRMALYLVQLGLYEVYRAFRWALVISGYVYPDADQLAHPFAEQFINPSPSLMKGGPKLEDPPESDNSGSYPGSSTELESALVGPYGHYGNNHPYWFIEGEPTDLRIEKELSMSGSAEATIEIANQLMGNSGREREYRGGLGSAVDFYLRRAEELHRADGDPGAMLLPDWNLDADRGYGFHCWEASTQLQFPPASGVQVHYI